MRSAGAAADEGDDVPTAVDYEDQAQKDITDDNREKQVKSMEDELGTDGK